MVCQDEECKRRMEEAHETLFADREGGVRWEIQKLKDSLKEFCAKKVSKKTAIAFLSFVVIFIGIPSYVAFINVWARDQSLDIKLKQFDTKDEAALRSEKIARLEEIWKGVKEDIDDLKKQQQKNTQEIIETIKRFSR